MEFEKLRDIIVEVLNVDETEVTMESTFIDDLGADSLDVFQIIMGIEEEFDIEIPNEEAEKIVTVGVVCLTNEKPFIMRAFRYTHGTCKMDRYRNRGKIMADLNEFQSKIGYTFKNRHLLEQALTHSSYANEKHMKKHSDNERLEFLGDAVLEIVSSEFLFINYPQKPEGELTKLRASIVCEPTLALCTKPLDLGKYLRLGRGEDHTGGRKRKSILSDALEAVIGAIYLDGGFTNAKEFVLRFIMTDIENKQLFYDSKTILQELIQGRHEQLSYELIDESGPDHDKQFTVAVLVDGERVSEGEGHTKKAAEQQAAYQALLLYRNRE
jgi:ribonuclease-3